MDILNNSELNFRFNQFINEYYSGDVVLTPVNEQQVVLEKVVFTAKQLQLADEYMKNSGVTIIKPTNNIDALEKNFELYDAQTKQIKLYHANTKSSEIFGMDCVELYELLKNKEKEFSIDNARYDDNTLGNKLIDLGEASDIESNHTRKKIIDQLQENQINRQLKWEFIYGPFFSPNEIESFNEFYYNRVFDKSKEIHEEYVKAYYGYKNDFNPHTWYCEVNKLMHELEVNGNSLKPSYINETKQSIITMGWNPNIKFTDENLRRAKARLEHELNKEFKNTSVLDLTNMYKMTSENMTIEEASMRKDMHPVNIVLVRGKSPFAELIARTTHGEFTHAALSMDNNFETLYSFNLDNKVNKLGGFSIENIKEYPKDSRLSIFTFFVDNPTYKKIMKMVNNLKDNIKNTTYSLLNVVTVFFKNINIDKPDSMICSQFVDKILKMSNMDITKISSANVTPNFLYNISLENSRLYKIFDDFVKNFNQRKAINLINKLRRKHPVKETTALYDYCIGQYEYGIITEAKKFLFDFNKDGDLLIRDTRVDFAREYYATHKILKEYELSNNIDGMKYELAKLYYMNYILENRIYKFKNYPNRDKDINTRSVILNDFHKYMKIVLKEDPNFNFQSYYEKSPFHAKSVKIRGTTISKLGDIVKNIFV